MNRPMTRRAFLEAGAGAVTVLGVSLVRTSSAQNSVLAADTETVAEVPVIWMATGSCSGCSVALINTASPTIEFLVGSVLPGTLLLRESVRNNRMKLFGCSLMVIVGVVMNRLNVCLVGMLATSPTGYLPSWIEIVVSAGIVAGGLLVLTLMNQTLPVTDSGVSPGELKRKAISHA